MKNNNSCSVEERQRRMSVLARASYKDMLTLWNENPIELEYSVIREPEIGMVQIRGKMGNVGDRFNVGDATITRASVLLETGEIGHCYMLGRNIKQALLASRIDAVMQVKEYKDILNIQIIYPLEDIYKTIKQKQKKEVQTSKVDFFTLERGED